MTIKELERALLNSYSKDFCYEKVRNHWTEENKTLGMCAITALIVNDYFKGDIAKIKVEGISHYFNIIDNKIIDLTKNQFKNEIDYKDYKIINRNDLLTEDTKNRYQTLKEKVIKELLQRVDQEVYQCTLCQNFVEKFPNSNTVYLGKNNDIVLIGEAPANNGWRKSHMLWKDINGNTYTAQEYQAFQGAYTQVQQMQNMAQMQVQQMSSQYQSNVSIWLEAAKEQLEAEQDAALAPLEMEETDIELDNQSCEAQLADAKARLESVKQACSEGIKDSAPTFGLG